MTGPAATEDIHHDELERSFALLADVVASAARDGKRPTAAGVKSAMLARDSAFSERKFNFRQFIEYLRAAEARGLVWIALDELGHPRVSDAPISDSGPALIEQARVPAGSPTQPAVKIRSDLWSATIPWTANVRRLWDRSSSRALVVPTATDGTPLWEARPERFIEISPVPKDHQIDWMREFARTQAEPVQTEILESLQETAAPGSFKRVLHRTGLEEAWTQILQARAAEHLRNWAASNSIPAARLFDKRPPRATTSPAGVSVKPSPSSPLTTEAQAVLSANVEDSTAASGYEARLRERMHEIIDRMSIAELVTLNVPAAYLVTD